ncbi:hypothetical protein COW81_00720 [Candidatus Campbellbacteria bacterium CG22_combo_CG10-13_8_21_14_all_36_13]|uniref:Uncharacterized protein n=1 Tax=Candidatus Campbellbacteria bacterium CG22_combo_CG10-13_8_21_14_all_36_13 TaxID=1974529 RepID=A0A2H0E078_9BACT|nr:MAG: hypothetical protein COW81_00720 [Candidatus Campbellbacteria bacterium CG22_combo_CG10-13_8_21_14_all_36_13]
MASNTILIIVLIVIFGFQGIRTLLALISSLRFLTKNQKSEIIIKDDIATRFIILIPCLCEQKTSQKLFLILYLYANRLLNGVTYTSLPLRLKNNL